MMTRLKRDESGVALVAAMGLVMLVAILMLTIAAFALREARQSGLDRQRASSVMSAEGQVDVTLAKIQGTARESLPCDDTVSQNDTQPDGISVRTVVTYFNGETPTTCEEVRSGALTVNRALVKSTAKSVPVAGTLPAERTVEVLVNMNPSFADGLDKAIFGNTGIVLSNKASVFGQDGRTDADLYTNGDFACQNNQQYFGSVLAQGSITASNTCTFEVDAWAGTGFTANNTGVTVKGKVQVSNGNVSIVRNAKVNGIVRASGSINWSGTCPNPTKCFPYAQTEPPPPQAFPILRWDTATRSMWAAAGYTGYQEYSGTNDCAVTGEANAPGRWLMETADDITVPTILRTTCQVVIQQRAKQVLLANNVAVFADGGVRLANSVSFASEDGAPRDMYLIQPYNAVSTPCSTDGISLDNQVAIDDSVSMLLYSPCNVRKANNTDHFGQIYAGGRAQIDNALTMYYRPLPVWGVESPTTSVKHYTLDILYKRENYSE